MPQITKYNRFKRATVLIKRSQCLGKYQRNKCMPSYEKLRSNNSSLAKALSIQKQKGQLLFSQNVALLAEVQDLNLACNKRDNTIVQVLQNAKEMLKMLVTMTKFVTSTISSCQEFVSSNNTNLRMSCNSLSLGDNRRLSTKLPSRGVVKPMVSGHIITKPSISLSRINIHHINNPSNLSTIEELSTPVTPVENSNVNNDSSPSTVPVRKTTNTTARTNRLSERLNISSPRISDGDERRSSKQKRRRTGRSSGTLSRSRSNRLSETNTERHHTEHTGLIGSPRVKLNDVSKLLHNCQTVNVRRLGSIQDNFANETLEMNDSINNTSTKRDKDDTVNSERTVLMDLTDVNTDSEETHNSKKRSDKLMQNRRKSFANKELEVNIQTKNRSNGANRSNLDDPLEGTSWMFNDSQERSSSADTSMETDDINGSNKNSSKQLPIPKTSTSLKVQANKENIEDILSSSEEESFIQPENESHNFYSKNNATKFCKLERENMYNLQENYNKPEENYTTNLQGFVTQKRGNSIESIDDDDDFTLMYRRGPINNIPFDINDLRLPVLEDSIVKSVTTKEPEPEITTTLQKITQNLAIPTTATDIADESSLDNSMVKLPLLSNTMDCTIPVTDISLDRQKQKKLKNKSKIYKTDNSSSTSPLEKKNRKQRKKSKSDKDPTAAKVVLQKLNESHVKLQLPLPTDMVLQNSSSLGKKSLNSSSLDNSSDSECSVGNMNVYSENSALKRPRRQKAPQNLKEPNLTKKLRRLE